MSMVCTICQDLVTELPQTQYLGEELFILSMQCGHIFHRCCIREWFNKLGLENENGHGQCPCCKKLVAIAEGLRLFPSGDEEGQAIAETLGKAKEKSEELRHMKGELDQVNMILEEVGCQLENEKVVHQILKFEYEQTLAQSEELKRQRDEQCQINASQDIKWKEVVQKVTNEKEEAMQQLQHFQAMEMQHAEEKQKVIEEYGSTIIQLERKLEIEFANRDSTKVRQMEQIHLNELKEYEKQLNRKAMTSKYSQTDGRDAALLQARLVSYKSCLLHMQSEVRLLESEYDKLDQAVDPTFGDILLNEVLNNSNTSNYSGDISDTPNNDICIRENEIEKIPVSMCVEEDGEDSSIQELMVGEIEADKPSNSSDDISQSGNEEFADAPLWCV